MSQLSLYQHYKQQEEHLLTLDDIPYPNDLKFLSLTKINELIQLFISAQDVRQSSKNTYRRTLRQYFSWVDHKGYDLSLVARPQIIEYKTDLLNSGLSAFTVCSYISSAIPCL
jgi:integrase/recombinase XerC/integrase/recombinase XerD